MTVDLEIESSCPSVKQFSDRVQMFIVHHNSGHPVVHYEGQSFFGQTSWGLKTK